MRRTDQELPPPPANDRPNRAWMCGAIGNLHGCDRGPDARGRCPLSASCSPQRTWKGKCRRWRVVAALSASVALTALLLIPFGGSWSKPGELSSPHAQILSSKLESDRCVTCHPAAKQSLAEWFLDGGSAHSGVDQSDQCLNCHHATIPPSLARSAHNLPEVARQKIRLASTVAHTLSGDPPSQRIDADSVACGVCHQEHQGPAANLNLVSDAKCQGCHTVSFDRFASDHPDWDRWPYGRGGTIAFDHATHLNKHFPAESARGNTVVFACQQCHEITADREITRTRSYESACAACHDDSLEIRTGQGIDLVSLPMLPPGVLGTEERWPPQATGLLEGTVSPLAELLLRAEPEVAAALRQLAGGDLSRLDPDQVEQRHAIATLARGSRRLLADLGDRGHRAAARRAAASGVRPETLADVFASLPPQLLSDTLALWFAAADASTSAEAPQPPTEQAAVNASLETSLAGDDLLLGPAAELGEGSLADPLLADPLLADPLLADPLLADPLLADPLAGDTLLPPSLAPVATPGDPATAASRGQVRSAQFDAGAMIPLGGWYRDDLRLAIRYRGGGHSDPTLRRVVDLLAALPPADPVRIRLEEVVAIKACLECHPSAATMPSTWTAAPRVGRRDEFTKFSHGPHLSISRLADCRHCHQISESNDGGKLEGPVAAREVRATLVAHPRRSTERPKEFLPLQRDACIDCHKRGAASDSCTTCHLYHIQTDLPQLSAAAVTSPVR